jgi:hypothetical protein
MVIPRKLLSLPQTPLLYNFVALCNPPYIYSLILIRISENFYKTYTALIPPPFGGPRIPQKNCGLEIRLLKKPEN